MAEDISHYIESYYLPHAGHTLEHVSNDADNDPTMLLHPLVIGWKRQESKCKCIKAGESKYKCIMVALIQCGAVKM